MERSSGRGNPPKVGFISSGWSPRRSPLARYNPPARVNSAREVVWNLENPASMNSYCHSLLRGASYHEPARRRRGSGAVWEALHEIHSANGFGTLRVRHRPDVAGDRGQCSRMRPRTLWRRLRRRRASRILPSRCGCSSRILPSGRSCSRSSLVTATWGQSFVRRLEIQQLSIAWPR